MPKFTSAGIIVTSTDTNWVGEATSNQPLYSVGYKTLGNTDVSAYIPSGGHWGFVYRQYNHGQRNANIFMGHCAGGMGVTGGVPDEKIILWRLE